MFHRLPLHKMPSTRYDSGNHSDVEPFRVASVLAGCAAPNDARAHHIVHSPPHNTPSESPS